MSMNKENKNEVTIKLYAILAEKVGTNVLKVKQEKPHTVRQILKKANGKTGGALFDLLLDAENKIKPSFSLILKRENHSFPVEVDNKVKACEELLLFPPFSGGSVPKKHKEHAVEEINFTLITVSTSRYQAILKDKTPKDKSAELAQSIIEEAGYQILAHETIPDDKKKIRQKVKHQNDTDVLLFMGGTGITPDDQTPEAVKTLFDKELTGFSQAFTFLSYQDVGSPSILSRATAGIVQDQLVITLPGAPNAVQLVLKELILPEAGHILHMIR